MDGGWMTGGWMDECECMDGGWMMDGWMDESMDGRWTE